MWRCSPWKGRTDFGLHEIDHRTEFFTPGVAGNVDQRAAGVDDFGPGPEELVDDPIDRCFVAGDRRGRDDDRVAGSDRNFAVVAVGDPAEHRHRLALAAGDDEDDLVVRVGNGVFRVNQHAVRVVQVAELERDPDVVFEAPAEGRDLAAVVGGGVHHLLDAGDQ